LSTLPQNPSKSLVHGDLFFENILVNENLEVVSLIDFSGLSVIGDYRLDIAGIFNYFSYFDFVSKEDISLLKSLKKELFNEKMIQLIDFYDVYMAFIVMKDTKYDDPKTYQRSVEILNGFIEQT
jgi:aminoglycoside phosphotransferase (APT) family kinase protein